MEEKKKTFVIWIKKHKSQLIIAGISVTAVIALILGSKNYEALEDMWILLKKLVEKAPEKAIFVAEPQVPKTPPNPDVSIINAIQKEQFQHSVSEHIRNLHDGWNASQNKIAMAMERGYILKPGQTWVVAYTKGKKVA